MATKKKTEGLSYPSNPLAAMRDLQELDAPTESPQPDGSATQQQRKTSGNTATQQQQKQSVSAKERVARRDPVPPAVPATSPDVPEPHGSAAVRLAMLNTLLGPFESDLVKGATTATTLRLPTELWERLGMASAITGKTKQDLVSDALQIHLRKVAKDES